MKKRGGGAERRRKGHEKRVPAFFEAELRVENEVPIQARTANVSMGGAAFDADRFIAEGVTVQVLLRVPEGPAPLPLMGKVMWSNDESEGVAQIGVEFLEPIPEATSVWLRSWNIQ